MRDRDQEVPAGAGAAPDVETQAPVWAVPGVTGTADDATRTARPRLTSATTTAQATEVLLGGVPCASDNVLDLARAAALLVDQTCSGELGAGAQLADDVTVLARTMQLLAAETARRVHVGDVHDVTPTGVTTTLTQAGWSKSAAWRCLHAGAFAAQHPDVLAAWRAGCVNVDTITGIVHKVRGLPDEHVEAVIGFLTPLFADLDDRQLGVACAAAVDRLRPADADAREPWAYDRRYLASTRFRDQIMIEAQLPVLEGEAFLSAVEAFAEKLRTEDDGLTKAQRAADALAAMVAALSADGKTPSHHGQPAAATVLIPLSEAERVTNDQAREPQPLPDLTSSTHTGRSSTGSGTGPCGPRPFTLTPMSPGVIGTHHTLGDAAARFLLCAAELTGAIVTTGHDPDPSPDHLVAALLGAAPLQPLALGRAQRFASTAQRKALELRDRGCVIPGCRIDPRHCQAHHQPGWTDGGRTDIDHMALLCWPHHRQVDHGKWLLERNPDPTGPHWITTPRPRGRWQNRQ